MDGKTRFIGLLRRWTIVSLLILAALLLGIHTVKNSGEVNARAAQIRQEYVEGQRRLIKSKVERVVKVINYEIRKTLAETRNNIKTRVYEAHAVAINIHARLAGTRTDPEIKSIIIDALRPIRFDRGSGYYFINGFDGVPKLFADRPDKEGTSLLAMRDSKGKTVVRDMIDIVKSQGEGFYSYHWTKPGQEGNEYEKVSFVKRFEPYDWFIGTGAYLNAVEKAMQQIIADYVQTHRFGPNGRGYVFINELLDINGGKNFARVYANPNRPHDTGMAISDDYRDARGKMFRKEFLKGLREKGECYVDYWYRKIDNPKPSPKTSYFKLAANGRFMVAAGVYLDDVEERISMMQADMKKQLRESYFIISAVFTAVILAFILFFNRLSRRLESDFHLFINFFQKAALASEPIDKSRVRFAELDQLAEFANQMLEKKSRTETALRKSEEEYRILVENASDAIYITQDGVIRFCNPVTEKITGYPAEELGSIPFDSLIHPGDRQTVSDMDCYTTRSFKLVQRDEKITWVELNTVPVEWENRPAVLNFLRDITAQKDLETQLIQSQKREAIGTLSGGIAHDFNNILSGILGYSNLAKACLDTPEKAGKHIDQIIMGGHRATQLVRQILTFSRSGIAEKQPVGLYLIVKEAISFLRSSIPAHIEIQSNIASKAAVLADPTQIHQIILNLCTNAYHAMTGSGGTLSVELTEVHVSGSELPAGTGIEPGPFLRLTIKDTGTGMDSKTLARIFEPYFTTKEIGEGTGLGLAVVLGIVESHKGFIQTRSEPGKGSTFKVYFPVSKEQFEPILPKTVAENDCKGSESIMLVDDDADIRNSIREILETRGYGVTVFSNGRDALAAFRADPDRYDLLISDITMPKMTGIDLSEAVLDIRKGLPVILCTGYYTDLTGSKDLPSGVRALLQKPVESTNLLLRIRDILDTSAPSHKKNS